MITEETRLAILSLSKRGTNLREIAEILKLSRNTVRRVVRGEWQKPCRESHHKEVIPLVREAFAKTKGNVVRIREILESGGHEVPYSTLTRIVREQELREDRKQRAGAYTFGPGEEMQHDTSPHQPIIGGQKVKAQCAGLVLAYSRSLFIQYYPAFTRFEARVFLDAAFKFMDGSCPRCVIDNTHVIVAHGAGPDADIAPEMERFGQIYSTRFVPHAVGDPDRKARIERNFAYVEGNFLAGRTFLDWHDLNTQAIKWCREVANRKEKRSLGMSPEAAYLMEKSHLIPLPTYIPPVYQTLYRTVDMEGYVHVDTNRYSAPERLIGEEVEVHKLWERIYIFHKNRKIADHSRLMDKRDTRVTAHGHHAPLQRKKSHEGSSAEEKILIGEFEWLDRFVAELKKRSFGRGLNSLRRLLELKRTYPPQAFEKATLEALRFGLYDLTRLERIILTNVAGDFFNIEEQL